jgi:hypothetical protein
VLGVDGDVGVVSQAADLALGIVLRDFCIASQLSQPAGCAALTVPLVENCYRREYVNVVDAREGLAQRLDLVQPPHRVDDQELRRCRHPGHGSADSLGDPRAAGVPVELVAVDLHRPALGRQVSIVILGVVAQ